MDSARRAVLPAVFLWWKKMSGASVEMFELCGGRGDVTNSSSKRLMGAAGRKAVFEAAVVCAVALLVRAAVARSLGRSAVWPASCPISRRRAPGPSFCRAPSTAVATTAVTASRRSRRSMTKRRAEARSDGQGEVRQDSLKVQVRNGGEEVLSRQIVRARGEVRKHRRLPHGGQALPNERRCAASFRFNFLHTKNLERNVVERFGTRK